MPEIHAVIGSNFGDEGKGRTVDALAARAVGPCIVARHNSGAQAGHTVITPDGRRHVFSHVGSGTFAGAATYLTRHFASSPTLFLREAAELERHNVRPVILADPRGPLTTPYDMLINRAVEDARAAARHGSVGVGYGETIERGLHPHLTITVGDLDDPSALRATLDRIRRDWVPARLAALGHSGLLDGMRHLLASDALADDWLADAAAYRRAIDLTGPAALAHHATVIFEGAQGLLLGEDNMKWFPHLTRSRTGLANAMEVCAEAGLADGLRAWYVTRCYATRHGAGPLPHEIPGPPSPLVRDDTNRPHAYQGALRFARLDLDLLAAAVRDDLAAAHALAPDGFRIRTAAAITCLDQFAGPIPHMVNGRLVALAADDFAAAVAEAIGADAVLASFRADRTATTISLPRSRSASVGHPPCGILPA